jgi:Uma2 family endonuclease
MTTPAPEKLITAEEFERMPESKDHELIDGRLVPVMVTGFDHGSRVARITIGLGQFVIAHNLGTVASDAGFYVRRNPDRVRAPDVAFVPAGRVPQGGIRGFADVVPTLAIEVVSPGDPFTELEAKVRDFFAFGVERVWVVEMASRSVMVRRPGGGAHVYEVGETLTSDDAGFPIEGFALPVADIFA